jgi:hypothetical protein
MGLYKGTVQNIITGFYMLPNADDKRKLNISKKKVRGKVKKGEEVIYKAQYTSFFGLGGFSHRKGENYQKGEICRQILKDRIYGIDMSIVLSLNPTKIRL